MTPQYHSILLALLVAVPFQLSSKVSLGNDAWVVYEGQSGPGLGKHIVLISGDEEYRSEEALPQLARILARHHGFRCTVLFAVDPVTGWINPNVTDNIPGLEALESADLMVLFTRFRALPETQMQRIDDYLKSGRPVVGLRTATHAFQFDAGSPWARYGNDYRDPQEVWTGGFGRLVLGEHWIRHHGRHKEQSTRGRIAPGAGQHPITRGIQDGDIWGPTDVYGVRLPLPGDSFPVVLGQVLEHQTPAGDGDAFWGMRPEDPAVDGPQNDPMMPIAWTKTYRIPEGQPGRAFTSTMGSATDLVSSGTRRLLVNGVYWALGLEDRIPVQGTTVDLVGKYHPTAFQTHSTEVWNQRALKPASYAREVAEPEGDASSKRVVIVTGQDYPGHLWQQTSPVLAEALRQDPRLHVEVVDHPSFLASPQLDDYDVVVLHFMDWEQPDPGSEARENLRRLVQGGKGLVLVHFACGAFQEWPEFGELAGRVWDPNLRPHDPHGAFQVDIVDGQHPITRGMASFATVDELYTCLAGSRSIQVLATARSKVDQKDYPMAFVLHPGKGRVFHCPLGHDVQAFQPIGVQELFRRGCAWTACLEPAATRHSLKP